MRTSKISGFAKCEQLIELVREQPVLYNPRLPEYRDAGTVKNTWESIAQSLGLDGISWKDARTRWRTLRDMYVKKKRQVACQQSSDSKAAKWKYMDIFSFLDWHIQDCSFDNNTVSGGHEGSFSEDPTEYKVLIQDAEAGFFDTSMESTCPRQDATGIEEGFYDCPTEAISSRQDAVGSDKRLDDIEIKSEYPSVHSSVASPSSSTPTIHTSAYSSCMPQSTPSPVKPKKRKAKEMSQFESSFIEFARDHVSRIGEEQPIERHAMDAFFESCAIRARRLSVEKQGWLQMQVSVLMYQVETSGTRKRAAATFGDQLQRPSVHGTGDEGQRVSAYHGVEDEQQAAATFGDQLQPLSACSTEDEEQTSTNADTTGQQDKEPQVSL